MTEQWVWAGIALGLVIIIVLLAFIRKQYRHLEKLKNEQQALQQSSQAEQNSLRLDVLESIKVIGMVMLDDQVEISEGCIRIKVLLDNLDPALHEQEPFEIFSVVTAKLAHMPTHDARKQVDKKFIRKLDKQRFQIEQEHREQVRAATKALLAWLENPIKSVQS